LISATLESKSDPVKIKEKVYELCDKFPLER